MTHSDPARILLVLDALVICGMTAIDVWEIVIGDTLGAAGTSLLLGLMLSGTATRLGRSFCGDS